MGRKKQSTKIEPFPDEELMELSERGDNEPGAERRTI